MKIDEYLKTNCIQKKAFAKKIGISENTLEGIIRQKRDIRLSIALKIEQITKGEVKCMDMLCEDPHLKID